MSETLRPKHPAVLVPLAHETIGLHWSVSWHDKLDVALMYVPTPALPFLDERPSPPAFFVRLHGVFGPFSAQSLSEGHELQNVLDAERHPNQWRPRVGHRPWWKLMDDRPRLLKLVEEAIVKKGRMSLADLRALRDLLKEVGREG